jgi:hypothetical protein
MGFTHLAVKLGPGTSIRELTPWFLLAITYADKRYERLVNLSVSHLYNLRKSSGYLALRVTLTKTRPVCNPKAAGAQESLANASWHV